jgi:hypothetical protein
MQKYFYYLTFISLFIACNNKSKVILDQSINNNESPTPLPRFVKTIPDSLNGMIADTLLYFKRSPCFGQCSAYEFTVYTNGIVSYNGYSNTEPLGEHLGLLLESSWNEILSQARAINFFQFSNKYPEKMEEFIADLPNTFIMIKEGTERKMIMDNHSPPKELKLFEVKIDGILKSLSLKKVLKP